MSRDLKEINSSHAGAWRKRLGDKGNDKCRASEAQWRVGHCRKSKEASVSGVE